jgi:Dolichyl-phosphate-mannose-protein mannosyltransferase
MKNERWQGIRWAAAALVLYFGLLVSMQRHLGAPQAEFGGTEFPDEASHYISGLMFHDYLVQGMPQWPVRYATSYYIHIPYFAVGYWPPMFYVAESVWMICFGSARGEVLLLTALISALIAALLFFTTRGIVGAPAAFGIGLLFLLAPVVQQSGTAIMTDLPVALGTFVSILALARYVDSGSVKDAVLFGVLASCTILTKSSGFVLGALPPAAVLLTGRFHLFKRSSFWLMGIVVVVICGPWFLFTRDLISIGFVGIAKTFTGSFLFFSLALWHNLGLLLALSLLGAWRLVTRRPLGGLNAICMVVPVVAVLFFAISPTANEPRYLIAAFPPLLVLAASGFQWIAQAAAGRHASGRIVTPVLMAILVAGAAWAWLFDFPPIFPSPFRQSAEFVTSHPYEAVLVNTDFEGPQIAEIASLEQRRARGRYLIRPSKMFARMNWMGSFYECRYKTPEEIETVIENLPVDLVILRREPAPTALLHERLLHQAVFETFSDRWRKVYSVSSHDLTYDFFEPVSKPAVSAAALEKTIQGVLGSRFQVAQ